MTHSLENKLKRCIRLDKRLHFKTSFSTTKVNFFTNNKDKTPGDYKANVVYRFCCPGCSAAYIGKTERNLQERCVEHATRKDSAIFDHLRECNQLNYLKLGANNQTWFFKHLNFLVEWFARHFPTLSQKFILLHYN
eukprot:TCONS_00029317-protein